MIILRDGTVLMIDDISEISVLSTPDPRNFGAYAKIIMKHNDEVHLIEQNEYDIIMSKLTALHKDTVVRLN